VIAASSKPLFHPVHLKYDAVEELMQCMLRMHQVDKKIMTKSWLRVAWAVPSF